LIGQFLKHGLKTGPEIEWQFSFRSGIQMVKTRWQPKMPIFNRCLVFLPFKNCTNGPNFEWFLG
jgi:hypothetical protein